MRIYRSLTADIGERRRNYVRELVELVPLHPITLQTAFMAGQIEGEEAAKGLVIPFNDLLIAVSALQQGYAVLTGNLRHFRKVPGLRVVTLDGY